MSPFRALLRLFGLLLAFAAPAASAASSFVSERGTLPSGVTYLALKPTNWDRHRLLLYAPAQRAEAQSADAPLDYAQPLVRTLLSEGWLVATAAYRRSGVVLKDSMEDLEQLRAQLAATHGQPDRVYVLGESLGAAIAVRMMENYPDDYAGALAVGGAFDLQEPAPTIGVAFSPQRPLLLLPNRSESDAPNAYVKAAARALVPPVLWHIARDGRANTNAAEKLAALAALVSWAEDGTRPPQNFDATAPPPMRDSVVEFSADRTEAVGEVLGLDPLRGDLTLNFQPADLEQLGIARGTFFAAIVNRAGGARTLRVLYGQNLRRAKPGDWMALPEAEGWMLFAVFRGNAAAVSGLRAGDKVTLRRLRDQ
ncbi:MAG: hypothetical protein C0518_04275 [Opitutus sp.]|nr:hypothetical protein [Opitutus sp.]